jgi:enoyl-CoA hydratase/carnithine racemase
MQRAMEWMLTGRTLTAREVHEAGLVLSTHPAGEVLGVAMDLAGEIATQAAPVSAALTRQLLWRMMTADHPMAAHQAETHALNLRGLSADAAEGVSAFLEKRPPNFLEHLSDFPRVIPHDDPDFTPPPSGRSNR